MLHTKKISLTILLIFSGFGTYKYLCAQQKNNTPNKTNQKQGRTMDNTKKANTEVTTPSGLRYTILQEAPQGSKTPQKGNKVTVHYTGYLDNNGERGKKFDSSVDRGTPFSFIIGVGQVIQGWDEGVMGMLVGEKRLLRIPANLGYGARGAGAVIPPNATLLFDVELIDTK